MKVLSKNWKVRMNSIRDMSFEKIHVTQKNAFEKIAILFEAIELCGISSYLPTVHIYKCWTDAYIKLYIFRKLYISKIHVAIVKCVLILLTMKLWIFIILLWLCTIFFKGCQILMVGDILNVKVVYDSLLSSLVGGIVISFF